MPLALAAALISLLVLAPSAHAAFPGPNGKIAYVAGEDVYTMSPDGTGATNITNSFGYSETGPNWSPDGTKVAYSAFWSDAVTQQRIGIRNSDGTDPVELNIGGAHPTWSPDGTKLAFVSDAYYGTEISVAKSDGTGLTRLTNDQYYDYNPSWSPDGAKIAFDRGGQIWIMNADGSGQAVLMSPSGPITGARPNWSPDGRKLVFQNGTYGGDIFTVNADGTGLTNVTNTPNVTELDAAFSPDGTRIVFSVAVFDRFEGGFPISQNDLYVMNADGTGRTPLLTTTASETAGDWQPVGPPPPPVPDLPGKIAFTSTRDNFFSEDENKGREIYVMNPDGTSPRRRTFNRVRDGGPSWSPDGTRIAFDRDGGIWTMNADGSGETRLTTGPNYDFDPTWSPDGQKVAFTRYTENPYGSSIWTVNSDGTGEAPLVEFGRSPNGYNTLSESPAWSPDGTKIAFVSNVDEQGNATGFAQIYIINPDGTGLQNLSKVYLELEGESDTVPAWSQDGRTIAFARHFPYVGSGTPNQIWIMKADGSGQVQITNPPGGAYWPAWSPDGLKIAFAGAGGVSVMYNNGTGIATLANTGLNSEPDWQAIDRPLISASPRWETTSPQATFEFGFPKVGMSYACSLDGGGFESCESPRQYSGLTDGTHRFEVRTSPSSTPAVRVWTVDATGPEAFDLGQPAAGADVGSNPAFSWNATSDATSGLNRYELFIDGSKDKVLQAGACTEGNCLALLSSLLPDGHHTWQVRAIDNFGNVRESELRSLTVVDPPSARLAVTPTLALTGEEVVFDASGSSDINGPIARYQWDLDGDGTFERDTGTDSRTTRTYPSRLDATVKVRVTDSGGSTAEAGERLLVTNLSASGHVGISINGGAAVTNDPNVQLNVRWPSRAIKVLVSNDGGFDSPSTFDVDSPVAWRLSSTGPQLLPKTVYVRFTGGEAGRETYTDDIILDETQPAVQSATATPLGGGSAASVSRRRARKYRVRIRARDAVTGIAAVQVSNSRKRGRLYKVKKARRFVGAVTFKSKGSRIYVRVRDAAGNLSRWRKARITR